MQAQSRFSVSSGSSSSSSVSADEHEAVIRELTRGHELTAQLQAEALRALQGNGEAEATAAGILQKVSGAFAFCLNIMGSPAARAPPSGPPTPPEMPEQGRRTIGRDENVPRRQVFTYSPYSDGYQWRKYGQKRITNTIFPRCYYRCSYFKERGCPATKLVQQHRHGDPPEYVVFYVKDHTCDSGAWEPVVSPPASAGATNPLLMDHLSGLARQQGLQEEHERQALVSSLASVLGARPSPAAEPSRTRDAPAPASASVVDQQASGGGGEQLPRLDVDAGLDVMDYYDVTGALYFGDSSSYGLPPDHGLPF